MKNICGDPRPIAVVLGGSFNPPTLAHRDLAAHAAAAVAGISGRHAEAVAVPSSDAYVRRKMSKEKRYGLVFSEQARKDMLLASQGGGRVSDIEFGDDGRGRTYETMRRLQDADPDTEYMFLAGADKLKIIPRWHDIEKFLSEFRIVVTARDGLAAHQAIRSDPLLSRYQGSFVVIPELDSPYASASSTEARRRIRECDTLDAACELCGYGATRVIERELDNLAVDDMAGGTRKLQAAPRAWNGGSGKNRREGNP